MMGHIGVGMAQQNTAANDRQGENSTTNSEPGQTTTMEFPSSADSVLSTALGFARNEVRPDHDVSKDEFSELVRKHNNAKGGEWTEIEVNSREVTVLWDALVRYREDGKGRGNCGPSFTRVENALLEADRELNGTAPGFKDDHLKEDDAEAEESEQVPLTDGGTGQADYCKGYDSHHDRKLHATTMLLAQDPVVWQQWEVISA